MRKRLHFHDIILKTNCVLFPLMQSLRKMINLKPIDIMPNLSERAVLMPSSPIRKLAPFANAAKERGLKVYHLNIGQPDLDSPQIAIDAIKKIDKKILENSPSEGLLS